MTETTDGVEVSSCEPKATDEPAETDNLVAQQEAVIATKKHLTEKEDSSVFSLPEKPPPDEEDVIHAAVVVPPADGGWGWVVVASSFVCNFFVDGIIFSFGVYLEQMKITLDASTAEVALVGSLLAGCYLLAGPFVSALANKYGFRLVTIVGAFLASAGFLSASFAESTIELFLFCGLIGGVGCGLIYSPSILIVGFYFERWRALATGVAVCGSGIGMLVLAPLFTNIIDTLGWRTAMRVQAAMMLVCILCGLVFRPLKPVQIDLGEDGDENLCSKRRTKSAGAYPTAAELLLSKSTQSLAGSVYLKRAAMLSGQTDTQSVPMMPVKKRDRTLSENSSIGPHERSRRGTVTEYIGRSRRGTLSKLEDLALVNRPLYRDDIFFTGSLHRLADYRSSQRDFMGYTLSVTRLPTRKDLEDEEVCACCGEAVRRALANLFDTSLLKSPSFVMLCISGFLTLMGIFTPVTYLQDRAIQGGMEASEAAWLVSAVGVSNTVGRVICGVLSSCPGIDALLINNIALTLGGIATMASSLSLTPAYQFTYSAAFGFTLACFASLRSILAVDLLGIEKLTNAFGILLLFQGVAAVLGSPIAGEKNTIQLGMAGEGYIKQATGSYEWSFILAGGFILFSAILCYPLNAIARWEKKRKVETEEESA